MISIDLRKKKSTMYRPMIYCLRHFWPRPLDLANDQKTDSALVMLSRLDLAFAFKLLYSAMSEVCHFKGGGFSGEFLGAPRCSPCVLPSLMIGTR